MENQHINESILSEEILEDQKKNRIDHMKYMPGMEDIGSEILDQVVDAMHAYDYDKYTAADVKQAIAHSSRTPEAFAASLPTTPPIGLWQCTRLICSFLMICFNCKNAFVFFVI